MGPTWGPSGTDRAQVGPCWPHELCYQGLDAKRVTMLSWFPWARWPQQWFSKELCRTNWSENMENLLVRCYNEVVTLVLFMKHPRAQDGWLHQTSRFARVLTSCENSRRGYGYSKGVLEFCNVFDCIRCYRKLQVYYMKMCTSSHTMWQLGRAFIVTSLSGKYTH